MSRRAHLVVLVVGALWLGAAGPVRAERPIRLEVRGTPGELPFRAAELAAAVALRTEVVSGGTPPGDAVSISVRAAAPGTVEVARDGRQRQVEVDGLTGGEAARLVALMIVDLVRAEPLPEAVAVPPAPVEESTTRGEPPPGRFALAAAAGLALRTTDAGAGLAPLLEAQARLGARTRASLTVGFEPVEVAVQGAASSGTLAVTMLPVRLGLGARLGWAELRAGALARPHIVSGLASHAGLVWGGFAALSVAWPARGPLAAFGLLGLDVLPQPLAFTVADQRVLSLRTLAPFLALGAVWRGGRG